MRLTIVVQRYGLEVNGGAEQHARWLAEQLAPSHNVTVLTSCALDYITWEDAYPAGESELNGIRVVRFPVDARRDWRRAVKESAAIMTREHSLFDEIAWVRNQGPYAGGLFDYLRESYRDTDAFIFFTFHYATTYFGLPVVSDKSVLVPTAHDDPFVHMPVYRPVFHLPRGIIYNTEPERALVQRVTRNSHIPGTVAGVGVKPPPEDVSASRFRQKYGIADHFLLYIGRIHESKNVPELLDYFERYRAETAAEEPSLKLVLAGKSHLQLPEHADIVPIGFISEQDKLDAIAAADLVVLPSLYESLSMITLESWSVGTPVLVNERCEVVRYLCRRSHGGLYYETYDEFRATLATLLGSDALRRGLGRQGQQFVFQHFNESVIVARYTDFLESLFANPVTIDRKA